MVTVEKPDGRRVEYYDWPSETDGDDPADRDVLDRDAAPGRKAVGGV